MHRSRQGIPSPNRTFALAAMISCPSAFGWPCVRLPSSLYLSATQFEWRSCVLILVLNGLFSVLLLSCNTTILHYWYCYYSTVKYYQSAPPSRPFAVVLWRWCPVCRSYDTNLVHPWHFVQSIHTQFIFERTRPPHKNLLLKRDLSTLTFSHRTHFVALCHTIFISPVVKSRWGALARRGTLVVLYRRTKTSRGNHSTTCLRGLWENHPLTLYTNAHRLLGVSTLVEIHYCGN